MEDLATLARVRPDGVLISIHSFKNMRCYIYKTWNEYANEISFHSSSRQNLDLSIKKTDNFNFNLQETIMQQKANYTGRVNGIDVRHKLMVD